MTFSAGASTGVCAKAPKAVTSAAPKQHAFQPANMRIIMPPAFAPVHHGPHVHRPTSLATTSSFIQLFLRCDMLSLSRGLPCGRIRFGTHRWGFSAEGQPEFLGNLRPEFAQHIETRILQDAVAHPLRCWSETALVVRVICVAQYDRARCPQPFGKIEHLLAIVAVRHDRVLHRMEQAPPNLAVSQAVVARVL